MKPGSVTRRQTTSLQATSATTLFNAGVPDKLIQDVTGHRSNALQLYERPNMQQRQEVSKVLVQRTHQTVEKENIPTEGNGPVNPVSCSSNVSGVNNCTINISPQTFSVKVCSGPQAAPDIDVNALFNGIDIDKFLLICVPHTCVVLLSLLCRLLNVLFLQ